MAFIREFASKEDIIKVRSYLIDLCVALCNFVVVISTLSLFAKVSIASPSLSCLDCYQVNNLGSASCTKSSLTSARVVVVVVEVYGGV